MPWVRKNCVFPFEKFWKKKKLPQKQIKNEDFLFDPKGGGLSMEVSFALKCIVTLIILLAHDTVKLILLTQVDFGF